VLVDQLVSGLAIGGVYALVALGFALIFGVLRVAQFAHGELYMLSAFVVLAVLPVLPSAGALQFVLVIGLGLAIGACLGLLVDRGIFQPLASAPHLSSIISAVGLSIALQYLVSFAWGSELHPFVLAWQPGNLSIGPASVPLLKVVIILSAVVLLGLLQMLLLGSRLGRAIRATAIDAETARLMGIDTRWTTAIAFAIGSALAGAAGVLVAALYGVTYSTMGQPALLKGYTATILGGVGNLPGAVLGGLLIGVFEVLLSSVISPTWVDAVVYGLLFAMLALRPQGLLGRAVAEKL
jgi:branched-chain amino acid transport system permease protein